MSALTSAEVSAIVSTVVSASFSTVIRYGERLASFVRTRLPDDHTAINAGAEYHRAQEQVDRLAVMVSTAPSRRLRRAGLDIDCAISAVAAHFGEHLPSLPDRSGPDIGVSFTVMMSDDQYSVERRLWLYPSGCIDLYWCIPAPSPADSVEIDVMELLRPLLMLAHFVKSADYDRIYSRRWWTFRRRFDWRFVAAMYLYDGQRRTRSWVLRFPEIEPRRATDRQAFCPAGGYAADELVGWPMRRDVASLARVVLQSVLFHNGYHDVGAAVENVLTHISDERATSTDSRAVASRR